MSCPRPDAAAWWFEAGALPHLDMVWSIARRLTPDRTSAEDAVQETYLSAYRHDAARREGQIRPWLAAICVNVCRSQHRQSQRRPRLTDDADLAAIGARDDVEVAALDRVRRAAVAEALAGLPEQQRVAVVLVDIGGLTGREAAEVLGVPMGTVLSRVHRGRRRLAVVLSRQGHDHGR